MFIAVVSENNGLVTKFKAFVLQRDADDHIARFGGFVAPDPGGNFVSWVADPATKTLTKGPPRQLAKVRPGVAELRDKPDITPVTIGDLKSAGLI